MSDEQASIFVTPALWERIVTSDKHLIAIETKRAEQLVDQFRHFAVRSSSAIYLWNEGDGVQSLRDNLLSIPGSGRVADALRLIAASNQYGVYLFVDLGKNLRFSPVKAQMQNHLRQIGKAKTGGNVRKVVLIGDKTGLAEGFEELMLRVDDKPQARKRVKLRDGRWVVG